MKKIILTGMVAMAIVIQMDINSNQRLTEMETPDAEARATWRANDVEYQLARQHATHAATQATSNPTE